MHGLADHGVAAHGSVPVTTSHSAQLRATSAGTPTDHTVEVPQDPTPSAVGGQSSDGHGGMELLGLCLAVAAAMLLFGAGAPLSWGRGALDSLSGATRRAVARQRARDPAPPDLTRLCVQRC